MSDAIRDIRRQASQARSTVTSQHQAALSSLRGQAAEATGVTKEAARRSRVSTYQAYQPELENIIKAIETERRREYLPSYTSKSIEPLRAMRSALRGERELSRGYVRREEAGALADISSQLASGEAEIQTSLETSLSDIDIQEREAIREQERYERELSKAQAEYERAMAEAGATPVQEILPEQAIPASLEAYKGDGGYDLVAALDEGVPTDTLLLYFSPDDVTASSKALSDKRKFEANNIEVNKGEWISKSDWDSMDAATKRDIKFYGLSKYNQMVANQQTALDRLSKYRQYKYINGELTPTYDLTAAVIDGKSYKDLEAAGFGIKEISEAQYNAKKQVEAEQYYQIQTPTGVKTVSREAWDTMDTYEQLTEALGREPSLKELQSMAYPEVSAKYGGVFGRMTEIPVIGGVLQQMRLGGELIIPNIQSPVEKEFWDTLGERTRLGQLYYQKTYGGVPSPVGITVESEFLPAMRVMSPRVTVSEIPRHEWIQTGASIAMATAPFWMPKATQIIKNWFKRLKVGTYPYSEPAVSAQEAGKLSKTKPPPVKTISPSEVGMSEAQFDRFLKMRVLNPSLTPTEFFTLESLSKFKPTPKTDIFKNVKWGTPPEPKLAGLARRQTIFKPQPMRPSPILEGVTGYIRSAEGQLMPLGAGRMYIPDIPMLVKTTPIGQVARYKVVSVGNIPSMVRTTPPSLKTGYKVAVASPTEVLKSKLSPQTTTPPDMDAVTKLVKKLQGQTITGMRTLQIMPMPVIQPSEVTAISTKTLGETKTKTQTLAKTKTLAKTETEALTRLATMIQPETKPQPYPQPQPFPYPQPYPYPQAYPYPFPYPQPYPYPQPQPKPQPQPFPFPLAMSTMPTPKKTKPKGGFKLPSSGGVPPERKLLGYPEGTITWRQGFIRKYIKPPYKGIKPESVYEPKGIGVPSKTFRILGGRANINANIDLGVVDIRAEGERGLIEFYGGGLKTDVGKRHPSKTKGMSVNATPIMKRIKGVSIR